ncbi:type IV secretion system protein [Lysinibacillus sp. CNPSo 3705]|uniref:type IV secretion system protein n=1 Tax=Lysinibacillus sp. CNPSo 3705 TaxID=3028148 RepID=UPI0023647F40|nr:type IV secretion system protein [Lysinibacillus sp. CNPSo 3705]MDD1505070.1 type IV secretion system protein [Lysinibacillus sp. CNPSo 3705]
MGSVFEAIGEKILAIFESLLTFLYKSFIQPFTGLSSLKDLVYGNAEEDGEPLIWSTFHETDLTNAFSPIYLMLMTLAGIFFVAFIVIGGMRISSSQFNASRRNEVMDFIKDLMFVGMMLFFLPTLYELLFQINDGVINLFASTHDSQLDTIQEQMDVDNKESEFKGVIGKIAINLVLLGLALWANFYYMMRRVTLIILMGMGPLMLVFWMMPSLKSVTATWFKELTGSIFVQAVHAMVFWTIAVLSVSSNGLIETIIVYVIFIPISESLKGLLGMGGSMQSNLSKAGAMFGMSALAGMAGAVKGAMDGKSVSSTLQGLRRGSNGLRDGKKEEGNQSPDEPKSGSITGGKEQSFANSMTSKMLKAGDLMSRSGKAVFGMAGAVAGSGLGPAGAIALAEAGAKLGEITGNNVGRAGSAAAILTTSRLKAGKDAVASMKNRKSDDESLAKGLSKHYTNDWAKVNKDKVMDDLRERFPNATPQELEKKYGDIKKQKEAEYLSTATGHIKSAKKFAKDIGNGKELVNASAEGMAKQWAQDNRETFMQDYTTKSPQLTGESSEEFNQRKEAAFQNRINDVKAKFLNDGQKFLSANVGASGDVSRDAVAQFMSASAKQHIGIGDTSKLLQASKDGMANVQGASLLNEAGKPNLSLLANSIAHAKTAQQGAEFIQNRPVGVSEDVARQEWLQKEKEVYAGHVSSLKTPEFSNAINSSIQPLPSSTAKAFLSGAAGLNALKNMGQRFEAGANMSYAAFTQSKDDGQLLKAISNAINGFGAGYANEHIAQNGGDAALAQQRFTNAVGFAGALALGRTGLKLAQSGATSMSSPYTQAVQQQISSPSEVISMAQTTVDDHGNTQIAPGAIRQVITRDSSHIEVRTNSGEIMTVSRMGAGTESLKNGEVVYQDLTVDGDSLVVVSGAKGGPSTYRLDSGGAKIQTPVEVNSSHNSLLANPNTIRNNASVKRTEAPVFNQRVEAGNFFTEDISASGMSNPQVIVEKGRQYVTAEKDGQTYRISPIYAGDARLNNNDLVTIPVEVSNGQLQAIKTVGQGSIAQKVTQEIQTVNNVTQTVTMQDQSIGSRKVNQREQVAGNVLDNQTATFYDSRGVSGLVTQSLPEHLMFSRHTERAMRSADRRNQLDVVRRKQGILG